MTVTREDLVKTLGLDAKDAKTDRAVYGEVMSINEDQTYQVSLNGSDTTVKCARLSGAKVGDTVLVEILANGYSVVTGTVGGDTDASDAQASASAAVTAAGQAQSAAGQASTAASQALTKANEAEASASAASTAAAAAQTAADTADSKATAAGTAAAAAQSSADAAATAAATADSKADAASAAATRAETKADTASAAASRAESSASTASQAASQAVTDAAAAQTAAATADQKATTAGTAAAAAQTSADNAATAAATADSKADAASAAATRAEGKADTASAAADAASTAARDAQESAGNASEYASRALGNLSTVQSVTETLAWITEHGSMALTQDASPDPTHVYFVQDNDGDYTVQGVKYAIVTEPDADNMSSYYELSINESLNNYVGTHLAVTDEGLWLLPDTGGNKVLIATGGTGHTYSEAGTYIIGKVNDVDTVFAKFLQDGATITAENGVQIAHLGYGETYAPSGLTDYPFYTLGNRRTTIEPFDNTESYRWGDMCVYNGHIYVCVSERTSAGAWNRNDWKFYIGGYSHARGFYVMSCGFCSVADGEQVRALGDGSHAVGSATFAIGESSHAEGNGTYAIGENSHAEGQSTRARGTTSHAEGSGTFASGDYSHAQNQGTVAAEDNQTAIGKYNDNNQNNAFEIGNGSGNSSRSNAFEVDWNGNTEAAGEITDGSGNVLADKADSSSLATVATSGSYDDLSDKPTIPTVNDATLTIQKNGTNVQTFTANASSNKTANITVPTKTSELTNDSGFTGYPTAKVTNTGTEVAMSGLYVRRKVAVKDNISVTSGNYVDNSTSVSTTGYTLLGVLGYSLSNATTSGTGGMYGYIGQLYCTGNTVYYRICNRNSSAIKVKIEMDLLYFKS